MRQKKCKSCKALFTPVRSMQAVCSPLCGLEIAKAKREKAARQAAAQDRRETKAKLDSMKTAQQLKPEAKRVAQKEARFRDLCAGYGCISCGKPYRDSYGGAFDGGHLRSKGSAQNLALYLWNIYAQCVRCNRDLGGNVLEMRKGVVERKGLAFVEMLEADNRPRKFSAEYLKKYIRVVGKRARRLEKRYRSML